MMVGKSVSIDLNDLNKIQKRIEKGESSSLSEFVRNAVKKELRRWKYGYEIKWKIKRHI